MNFKIILFLCSADLISCGAFAQQWTLQDCIDYALEQNITLQQSMLSVESADVDILTAKGALLPNLSFSTSHNLINRPYQESSTTVSGTEILQTNSTTSYSGNYGLNLTWGLYQGGINRKTVKQNELTSQITRLEAENTANSIEESIVQNYIQILYAIESVKVNENTLELSTAQWERGKELYDVGSLSKAELAQLEAQVSTDRYQLVLSQSTLANYRLQLKQLLELDGDTEMELFEPEVDDNIVLSLIPDKQLVYQSALGLRPEIQSSQLNMEVSELSLKIAKAGYIPRLSANAGIGTNHTSGTDYTFGEQLKRGWNNSVGLTLSVPIYSNRQNKSAVEKAKIQQRNSELDYQQQQKNLYQTVEGMWLDAINYQQQYVAAKDNTTSSGISYELAIEKFNNGAANTVDLLQEKNTYLNAQQQMLQAKYMAVMSRLLLRFYAGEEIVL